MHSSRRGDTLNYKGRIECGANASILQKFGKFAKAIIYGMHIDKWYYLSIIASLDQWDMGG